MLWIYEHGDTWIKITEDSPHKELLQKHDSDYNWEDTKDWLKRIGFETRNEFDYVYGLGNIFRDCMDPIVFYSSSSNKDFYGIFVIQIYPEQHEPILVRDFPGFLSLMRYLATIMTAVSKEAYSEAQFQMDISDKKIEIQKSRDFHKHRKATA